MTTFATGDALPASFLNAIPRANLAQESAVEYSIPLTSVRWEDGTIPDTTGAAGNPALVMGGYGSGTGIFQGEDAQAALKTERLAFDFSIPECYVSAGAFVVTVGARFYDAGTNTEATKQIDLEAYRIASYGTAGSDINSTAAQTLTASMAEYSFTITAATLTPGDLVRVFIETQLQGDSNGALKAEVGGMIVKIEVKG